jgi:hypothetical protein
MFTITKMDKETKIGTKSQKKHSGYASLSNISNKNFAVMRG